MSLRDDLVTEYLAFKPKFLAGKRTMASMTDREQAGLHLRLAGVRALETFDSMAALPGADQTMWPTTHALLVKALAEELS